MFRHRLTTRNKATAMCNGEVKIDAILGSKRRTWFLSEEYVTEMEALQICSLVHDPQ
jgi:hypothetical protein